jgi:hypothetical protein
MQRLSITRRTVVPLQSARAAGVSEPHLHVLSLAAADYQEMPDLALAPHEAARLWNADAAICAEVLTGLVRAGLLRRAGDRYLRR